MKVYIVAGVIVALAMEIHWRIFRFTFTVWHPAVLILFLGALAAITLAKHTKKPGPGREPRIITEAWGPQQRHRAP